MDPTRWPHAPYSPDIAQQRPTNHLDEDQGTSG
jgi:hypothetical protein